MYQLSHPALFTRPKSPYVIQLRAARYLDDGGQAPAIQFCDAAPPKGDAQSAETFREVGSGVTDS